MGWPGLQRGHLRSAAAGAVLMSCAIAIDTSATASAVSPISLSVTSADAADSGLTVHLAGAADSTREAIRKVTIAVDRGPAVVANGTTSWNSTVALPSAGAHTLVVSAYDKAGHRTSVTRTVNSPSGAALPLGDIRDAAGHVIWHQVFTDDFATPAPAGQFPGSAYGSKWMVYDTGSSDTSGQGRYDADDALSVHDGVLDFHLGWSEANQRFEGAAALPASGGHYLHQLYGKYVMRYRVSDPAVGFKFAPLLWPYDDDSWPQNGEVDFPESDISTDAIGAGFLHWGNPDLSDLGTYTDGKRGFLDDNSVTQWHTASIEWTPFGVTMSLLDTSPVVTHSFRFHTPVHDLRWTLQAETATDGTAPSIADPGDIQVDWVAQYQYVGPLTLQPGS